jgi:hypothetical protein
MRGLQRALDTLYGDHAPMPADEQAAIERAHALAPYRKRQGDLTLVLPEPEIE